MPEALAAQPTSGAIPNAKGEPERTPYNVPPPPQCLPSPYHLMKEEEEIFKVIEEMPRFPGCEELPTAAEKKQCADKKLLEFIFKEPAPGPDAREEIPEKADEALPPTEATPSGTPLTFEPEGFRLFPNPALSRFPSAPSFPGPRCAVRPNFIYLDSKNSNIWHALISARYR